MGDNKQAPKGWSLVESLTPSKEAKNPFTSELWKGPREGEYSKILREKDDRVEMHIHRHPDGITISKYVDGRPVERYNLNTGKQEK